MHLKSLRTSEAMIECACSAVITFEATSPLNNARESVTCATLACSEQWGMQTTKTVVIAT